MAELDIAALRAAWERVVEEPQTRQATAFLTAAVPDLLDEVQRLRAELAEARASITALGAVVERLTAERDHARVVAVALHAENEVLAAAADEVTRQRAAAAAAETRGDAADPWGRISELEAALARLATGRAEQ